MKKINSFITVFVVLLIAGFLYSCTDSKVEDKNNFFIGWSSVNITPDDPVLLWGQRHARISEGILDSITATALAIEYGSGLSSEKVIMISCDLVAILDGTREPDMYFTPGNQNNLRDNVRKLLKESIPELKSEQIIINATHTHVAPLYGSDTDTKRIYGVKLDVKSPSEVQEFLSKRIAKAAEQAWENRSPGGISYGLGHAVVGYNRIQSDFTGKTRMYGNTDRKDFSHIEGYEDHSVNLLYTWNKKNKLTGVVVNVACPSQVTEGLFKISADYWHDTRVELRKRLGENIFILPQCSAAGDQSPHLMVGGKAEERMQRLMFADSIETGDRTIAHRKQIAIRIADAVTSVLPYVKDNIDWNPVFNHKMEVLNLTRRKIPVEDVNRALQGSAKSKKQHEELLLEIKNNPGIKDQPRWYTGVTRAFSQTYRGYSVKERYELTKVQPKLPVEIHVIRIGDVVIATNPFELYLDFGMRIKGRSPSIQTFLVQLTGSGTYVPSSRSVEGGSYGAEPASTLVGPEGGQELVERTLEIISEVYPEK